MTARTNLPNLAVGDRLVLRRLRSRDEDREVIVYKIGRKWGYAKPDGRSYPDVKFDLETGYEDAGGYTPQLRVLTPEMDATEKRHRDALAALKSHGLTFEHARAHTVPTETVEAIVALMEVSS